MENWNSLLINLAEKAMEAGQDVYGFVLEQSPELVKEVIFWGVFQNGVAALCNLFLIVAAGAGLYYSPKFLKKNKDWFIDECGDPMPTAILAFLCIVVMIVVGFRNTYMLPENTTQAAKAYCTPRIYMIEYTSDLINKDK